MLHDFQLLIKCRIAIQPQLPVDLSDNQSWFFGFSGLSGVPDDESVSLS